MADNEQKYANIHEETDKKVRRASAENCFFDMAGAETFMIGPHYSSAVGTAVRGEKVQVVLVNKERGTGSKLHTHPNEQFNLVLKGKMKFRVGNVEGFAGPGQMIYIPANAQHYTISVGDEKLQYVASKDTSYFVAGDAVDGSRSGAYVEPGAAPKAE